MPLVTKPLYTRINSELYALLHKEAEERGKKLVDLVGELLVRGLEAQRLKEEVDELRHKVQVLEADNRLLKEKLSSLHVPIHLSYFLIPENLTCNKCGEPIMVHELKQVKETLLELAETTMTK